jgi:hypothetical protein
MNRFPVVLVVIVVATLSAYGQARKQTQRDSTWYEQALHQLNPNDIDYGAKWEQRKRAILDQVGNPYFQYSFAATVGVVVLLGLLCVQHVSHKRALDIAALSIADVLRHDEYSRQVAEEAIRRHNEHIESCNRLIEAGQDSEAELQRVRKELADTKAENKSLRNQLATAQKNPAAGKAQGKVEAPPPPVKEQKESQPGHLVARIQSLQKELREEQRKNQEARGTSVDDHRA